MDYCWDCGSPMRKNSRERVCDNCGRTVQRHKNKSSSYNDNSSGDSSGTLGALLGIGLLGLALASSKKNRSTDDDIEISNSYDYDYHSYSLEDAQEKQNRRVWVKNHRKSIAICIFILLFSIAILTIHLEVKMLIPLRFDNSSFEGLKYTEVIQLLKESGFTNIQTKEVSDLTLSREHEHNLVTEVRLLHTDEFDENTKYPSNLWITVVYHTVELYSPPLTSKAAKGMNYEDVVKEFEHTGFTNISFNVEYDIITGWITDDGEVKSITINGNSKYDSNDKYRLDAEIIITYHTLRSNKPD